MTLLGAVSSLRGFRPASLALGIGLLLLTGCLAGRGRPDETEEMTTRTTPTTPSVATSSAAGDELERLTIEGSVAVPEPPAAIAALAGNIWALGQPAPDLEGTAIYQFQESGSRRVATVGVNAQDLAADFGALWVANASGRGTFYSNPDAGPGFPKEDSVQRVEPGATGEGEAVRVLNPARLVTGHGTLWALTPSGGNEASLISRVDPSALEVVNSIPIDGLAYELVATQGAVWTATSTTDHNSTVRLYRIDPELNTVELQVPIKEISGALLSSGNEMVVATSSGPRARVAVVDAAGAVTYPNIQLDYPQASLLVGGNLWVSTDEPAIQVFELQSGHALGHLGVPNPVYAFLGWEDTVVAVSAEGLLFIQCQNC